MDYVKKFMEYPILTQEEIETIFHEHAKGNQEATDRIVEAYLKIVIKYARKYAKTVTQFHDLVGVGCEGLMKALMKHDPDLKASFGL